MNRKKAISVIAVILAVLMLLSLVVSAIPLSAYADELDEIAALRVQMEELAGQMDEIRVRIEKLQQVQANVLEQKAALEEQNRLSERKLELIAQEIQKYEELIREKGLEVDAAKEREQFQLERYRTRIRAMEESGGYNILALFMRADNFSELITAIDDMGQIMESDKQLQQAYEDARAETEEVKAQYESDKTVYEGVETELREEQTQILSDMDQTDELLVQLEEEIGKAVQEYKNAQAAEEAATATIAYLIASNNARKAAESAARQAAAAEAQAQVAGMVQANMDAIAAGGEPVYSEEQIQQLAEQSSVGYVSGGSEGFVWPLPCSTRVTSRFGTRSDPFTGESRYHSGIDIDGFGNDGAPVVAAASGEVITASYDGSYGNYVVIDHGGTSTVYAHMSGLAVSQGQYVSQGQTIGYVGATGRATGTHLHFEVYVGDERVDPAQYFSGISYYNC